MVNIKIHYRENISHAHHALLANFEETLIRVCPRAFGTASLEWRRDESTKSAIFFEIWTYSKNPIHRATFAEQELQHMSNETFSERLYLSDHQPPA